jgi:NTE family protein
MACESINRCIGLALSVGGIRAVAFHAGVLKWFAENELLNKIEHISSVSGGSLFAGLVFQMSDYCWPTSKQYIDHVLPNIRSLLTSKSLQFNTLNRLLLNPLNWCFFLSRANVLAQTIESLWNITATIDRLPQRPVWSINGTTAETGRRFRFKGGKIGDYEIGYADAKKFKLAVSMAVSAAFPGGIGPLKLDTRSYRWFKRKSWNSKESAAIVTPKFKMLHLYDAGIYDNLGIEPLFDVGQQIVKSDGSTPVNFLVVSDAGAPYLRDVIPGPLNPGRLKRVADIAFNQVRALRVRSFVNFLQKNPSGGMYLQIGSNPLACIEQYAHCDKTTGLKKAHAWLSTDKISAAVAYKTTLSRMREEAFDLLARHGYETALWNEFVFLRD